MGKSASIMKRRCAWAADGDLQYRNYHDKEWGVPVHDDRTLFEFLILEGAQAGLSWSTILRKRENYRKAYDSFDASRIARYDSTRIRRLLQDEGIVRNRLKVHASVTNARAFLKVIKEFGSFDRYIWQFVNGSTIHTSRTSGKKAPARTRESELMSKDLKRRGFRFVGPTVCYAFMQAVGMVNDHTVECFRHAQLAGRRRR